jgi:carbamate kinase
VAQRRTVTAGEDGGQPRALRPERAVTGGIHATMQPQQRAVGDPPADRRIAQPGGPELVAMDHAELAVQQPGHASGDLWVVCTHGSPHDGRQRGTNGARRVPILRSLRAVPATSAERVVVALGGNAIAGERGADPVSQQRAVEGACEQIATLVAQGHEIVITHGNGPQVGNLLLKNDLARDVVPPVPLDWCVAQTQATLGFLIVTALEAALARRGIQRLVSTVITRVRVDSQDPAWRRPTKPIGRYVTEAEARSRIGAGEAWEPRGERGWRRVVASPAPLEILDRGTVEALLDSGAIVVAAGGGGIPMVREDGTLRGVEAVLDKDLTGALLARTVGASTFAIATDVEAVAIHYGTPEQEWLGAVSPERLRALLAEGEFGSGSMRPKVQAALALVEGGGRAVITALERLREGVEGTAGTRVER